jgi:hypothetical protein
MSRAEATGRGFAAEMLRGRYGFRLTPSQALRSVKSLLKKLADCL